MEVVPKNTVERAYTVVVLMFAMMVFSSFVSSITGAMTQLRQMTGAYDRMISVLRRYLQAYDISRDLSVRIIRYAEHQALKDLDTIQEKDVQLLAVLSKPLLKEFTLEKNWPNLKVVPVFRLYREADVEAMKKVSSTALNTFPLSEGDILFSEGMACDKMYIILGSRPRSSTSSNDPTGARSRTRRSGRRRSRPRRATGRGPAAPSAAPGGGR